jgi:hypothetical protein
MISLFLLSGLATTALSDDGALLPPQSTVVMVVGLPGDVESEKTYRDQCSTLTALLANLPNPPQKVLTLTDPTREKFLALGKSLAASTNPVVVFVWGHGGLQGQVPVFHVPGQRLTPADFKQLAEQVSGPEARWFLCFRGSGAFARELAGNGRQIISSEKDTMFNSDPVGMSLMLQLLRENPTLTFDALANAIGRATVAWYENRNLVRTEEPTLWRGKEDPQLLAPAANAKTLESEPGEKPSPIVPSVWKDIAKVDARNYPDADGVVLKRHTEYTLDKSPAVSAEHEEFIQVLTTEGKHFGDFDIAYWPPQEDITFLDCEVQQADGTLMRLDPESIRDAAEEAVGDYRTARRKVFSLPGIGPGAVLHVHFQTTWRTFPLPHVTLSVPLASELAVRDLHVQITVPRDSPFHFAFDQTDARDPEIQQTTYGTAYLWRFENVPAHVREILTPQRMGGPSLLVSTFRDWPEFTGWYERISRLASEVTPEISAKAVELTRDAKSDQDKVRAIYHYVTSLRYVAIPLGVNSFRPHAAANVLKNQFGDCKDKANLFNTLLRSQGIAADLVLVPRFSQAYAAVPGQAFNHAISRVQLGNETMWVDTTDDTCPFGLLPPGDAGHDVLVVDGRTDSLTRLPLPLPDAHRLKLHAQMDCSDAWPVKLNVTAMGFCDYDLRAAARVLGEMKTTQPLLAMKFRPVSGAFAMRKQTFTPISSLAENFTWQAEGSWAGLNPITAPAPFWIPQEWDAALHARNSPLFLNQGYPLSIEEIVELAHPGPVKQIELPARVESQSPPLRWSVQWRRTGDLNVVAEFHAEVTAGEVPVDQTPAFQRQLRELLTALAARATFR